MRLKISSGSKIRDETGDGIGDRSRDVRQRPSREVCLKTLETVIEQLKNSLNALETVRTSGQVRLKNLDTVVEKLVDSLKHLETVSRS